MRRLPKVVRPIDVTRDAGIPGIFKSHLEGVRGRPESDVPVDHNPVVGGAGLALARGVVVELPDNRRSTGVGKVTVIGGQARRIAGLMAGAVPHDDIAVDDARARQDAASGHRDGAGEFAVDRQISLVDEDAAADLVVT